MAKQGTILVVDDNKGILTAVQMLLGTCFEKVITISTPNKIKNTLHDENVDVVLLDMNFSAGINSGNEGLFLRDQEGLSLDTSRSLYRLRRHRSGSTRNQGRSHRFRGKALGQR